MNDRRLVGIDLQVGATIRPQLDTHLRIASITKTMTSAVILQLAQEGKLRLSDPVSRQRPRFC